MFPVRGCPLIVRHGVQDTSNDDGNGAHDDGGNEQERDQWIVCAISATVQTASYSGQMLENQRKQICSSQANEYTYKLLTTPPSPTSLLDHRCHQNLCMMFRQSLPHSLQFYLAEEQSCIPDGGWFSN